MAWSLSYQRLPHQIYEFLWPAFFVSGLKPETTLLEYENVTLYMGLAPFFLLPLLGSIKLSAPLRALGLRLLLFSLPFAMLTFAGETRLHDLLYLVIPLFDSFRACNNAWVIVTLLVALASGVCLEGLCGHTDALPEKYGSYLWKIAFGLLALGLVILVPCAQMFQASVQPTLASQQLLAELGRFIFWWVAYVVVLFALPHYKRIGAVTLVLIAFFDLSSHLGENGYCNHATVSPAVVFAENRVTEALKTEIGQEPLPVRVKFAWELPSHWFIANHKMFTTSGFTTVATKDESEVNFLVDGDAPHPFANVRYIVSHRPLPGRKPFMEFAINHCQSSSGFRRE